MSDPINLPSYSNGFRYICEQWLSSLRRVKSKLEAAYPGLLTDFERAFALLDSIPQSTPEGLDFKQKIENVGSHQSYYCLLFKIPLIEDFIAQKGIRASSISVGHPLIFSDEMNLDQNKLHSYLQTFRDVTLPIITVYHPYIFTELVIDGNHRYEQAKRFKQAKVPAYRLNATELFQILGFDLHSQILYVIHHNITVLRNNRLDLYKPVTNLSNKAPNYTNDVVVKARAVLCFSQTGPEIFYPKS